MTLTLYYSALLSFNIKTYIAIFAWLQAEAKDDDEEGKCDDDDKVILIEHRIYCN